MNWEWREHNRAKVLAHLQQGDYEAIVTSQEGALDALAHLATELGVLDAVSLLEVDREREGIPDEPVLWRCGVESVDQTNPSEKEDWVLIST